MTANRALHKGNYTVAFDLYSKILHEKRHPVAYLNRALCYTAEKKPHLAVNDALRAYMMAQAIIDVNRDRVAGNDHIRRIDRDISSYRGMCTLGTNFAGLHHLRRLLRTESVEHNLATKGLRQSRICSRTQLTRLSCTDDCTHALAQGEEWCSSASTVLRREHSRFKLAKMTLVEDHFKDPVSGRTTSTSDVEDLKFKALFRLVDALARCGAGSAHKALHILDDKFMASKASKAGPSEESIPPSFRKELDFLFNSIENRIFEILFTHKPSIKAQQLDASGHSLLNRDSYGFAGSQFNIATLNGCINTVNESAIVRYDFKFGVPTSLVATQDVFQGMILFTESLPFAVSTAKTWDTSELATVCDTCGADLQIPSPFVLRVLIEELRHAESEKTSKQNARTLRRAARFKPSPVHYRRTASVDIPAFIIPALPIAKLGNKLGSADVRHEHISAKGKERKVEHEDDDDGSGADSDDDWNSESSSEESHTSSEHSIPNTPLRGRSTSRPGIFETADIQVCRAGNEQRRENFSFCSVDCYDLAKSTYHDSVCGSHLENYLRDAISTMEHPKLPTVEARKLGLLLLARVLGWAYATSTDPLGLPVVQLLMASPRYGPLEKGGKVAWSFDNNVMRPFQMLQTMDGRGDAPKSVSNPNFSDGCIINTIISLIHRHMNITDKILWTKTYDEEGYHGQTYPYAHKVNTKEEENVSFGRLYPLCDLVPLAAVPEDANVELVDLGDGRIICLPTLAIKDSDGNSEPCLSKGAHLFLKALIPRLATKAERTTYARKEDYGEGGTMMDADQDEGVVEQEPEEDYSGYVDEESYGARDELMNGIDQEESDEDLMDF
ncbi:hypothetical protein D6C80_02786 [Aureobasidium pullulans]|nr:hypothetical protein D6C80_02786 [Aureobasidium pullulans]